jgi:hypothetical protein
MEYHPQAHPKRSFESSANELLVLLELVLRIGEAFFESSDFPMGMREVKVRICVLLRGVGPLLVRVGPVVGLQL